MTSKRTSPIPERKLNSVKELIDLIKKKKTILIASIKNLPASQFQEIGKKLRGKAVIKVPKKNLWFRSLDGSKDEEVKKLKEHYTDSIAVLFSDLDAYDLSAELIKNKTPTKAKPGQVAIENIEIPEGPTDLVPGPAISELGALGIKIQIDKGKIAIKEAKVIARAGEIISQAASDVMAKLDIKPFTVGFIPISAFDNNVKKMYLNIKIDKEGTVKELKNAFGKSLAFAVEIGYSNKDTISFLLGRAGMHEKALLKLLTQTPEVKSEGEEK